MSVIDYARRRSAPGTAASPEPVVAVRDLRIRYGPREALAGVDLEVQDGEVLALLGPNGAGKTSLVEILEGNRLRSGGAVSVLGVDPAVGGLDWRARLGIVLQNSFDHEDWRVETLVREIGRCYPRPRSVAEVLDLVGLSERGRSVVRELSGGQRRRLDVALGIVGRPELLFLDEPTTGFDPVARRELWGLIEGLAREGVTVILTTHYLDEAERLASRIAILIDGQIRTVGTPESLAAEADSQSTVRWQDGGAEQVERTDRPEDLVWELSGRFGGPIPGLEVRRPTLEEAYLDLIGERAR
jgi:ABC-2 type transport system ATP-binding protein